MRQRRGRGGAGGNGGLGGDGISGANVTVINGGLIVGGMSGAGAGAAENYPQARQWLNRFIPGSCRLCKFK